VASASTAPSSPKSLGAATSPVDDAAVEPLVEPLPDQADRERGGDGREEKGVAAAHGAIVAVEEGDGTTRHDFRAGPEVVARAVLVAL
jgi:hypothetical protein